MIKLVKVAVTGSLSSGKSSVCLFLKQLGAYVVSADDIVHQLLSPKTNLGQQIINQLGPDIVINERFDHAKIAQKVFQDSKLLSLYENLLHPAVQKEIENHYQKAKAIPNIKVFAAEIPLLFEVGADKFYDAVIVVEANPDRCKERFAAKGYHSTEYDRRMARQLSQEEKINKATYVIKNNDSLNHLQSAVANLYNQLIHL